MQPPTELTHAERLQRLGPRGDEDELYRRHHRDLHRAVSRAVSGTPELIEDACRNAWAILLRRQPDRVSVFGWLYVVAVHEAYRLSRAERREMKLEEPPADLAWEERIVEPVSLEDRLEALEALRALAELPDRQRRDLTLFIAGFSYREIAEMTDGRTYTNVTKHLAKARARLRRERP